MSDYCHWIIPEREDCQYVPDAAMVAGIVSRLADERWIGASRSGSPYDSDWPSYYSSFPGPSAITEVSRQDPRYDLSTATQPVIRASHCRSVTMMVTDTLLIAPAAEVRLACHRCGRALVLSARPDMSQLPPQNCESCGAAFDPLRSADLPLFRFALMIELWYPPARADLVVDPRLLSLLREETGRSFREMRHQLRGQA